MIYKCSNEKMANAIRDFMIKNDLTMDTFIYYDNKRIKFNDGIPEVQEGHKASKHFEYGVDEWVCLSFEGRFNHMVNYPASSYDRKIVDKFEKMINSKGGYSELGYAWSMNIVPDN